MGKITFTICTPIPMFIPREIAVQALHDHSQVINTNPLVLEHKPITAPKEAAFDELQSAWYEIVERIQYVPGLGKMGSGKISFPGCFHDMPWGLQTHIHAPLSIDLRMQYRIAGEVMGVESLEPRELGLASVGAPDQGLYLRTDAEVKCNGMLSSFVRSQTKDATNAMVAQIVKNAERMDSDILARMITDERLARNATIRAGRRGSSQPAGFAGQPNYPPMPSYPTYLGPAETKQQPRYSQQLYDPPLADYSTQPDHPSRPEDASQAELPQQIEYSQQSEYSRQPVSPMQPEYNTQRGHLGPNGQNWI